MLENIKLWWEFEGRYYHKDFINGVKNLIRWFPIIWRDRDWDQTYIYRILRKKLEFQSDFIGKRGIHLSAKRDSEIMVTVSRLIKLQQEEFYSMEYSDYHNTKIEFVPTDETKKWFVMEDTLLTENFDDYFKKYPRQYKKVLTGEICRFGTDPELKDKKEIAMEIAHENQERCRKLIFKIMEDNIERWWD
jgi:hypothetical protein